MGSTSAPIHNQASGAANAADIAVPAEQIYAQIGQLEARKSVVEHALVKLRAHAVALKIDPTQSPRSLVQRVQTAFGGGRP